MLLSSILIISHFELFDLMLHFHPVNINLILHAVKLIVPSSSHIFFLDHRLGCILSQFLVGWTVLVNIQSSPHTALEVLEVV
jgi:hypothetical protein